MPTTKRNRNSNMKNEKEKRAGEKGKSYTKLPDNPRNLTDNASTRVDEDNSRYSRAKVRRNEKSK